MLINGKIDIPQMNSFTKKTGIRIIAHSSQMHSFNNRAKNKQTKQMLIAIVKHT